MKNLKLKATMAVLLVLALVSICLGGCDNNGEYKPKEVILDGGGWKLEILYTDGTKKAATGKNIRPQELQDSANSFEELCGVKVV